MNPTTFGSPAAGLSARFRADPVHFLVRVTRMLRARIVLRRAELGPGVGVGGRLETSLHGTCVIGARTTFRGGMIPTRLAVDEGASLTIGEGSIFNFGVFLETTSEVRIGSRCMFASMVRVTDRDGDRAGPVTIGDGVWIAHGALIQPGVTIGEGAVVSAGSVVVSDVPPRSLAMGNPARCAPLTLVSREEAGPRTAEG